MTAHKDIWELILIWTGVITSIVTPFLPLLQFIGITFAIIVSAQTIYYRYKKSKNNV
jgi:hypothetical protein